MGRDEDRGLVEARRALIAHVDECGACAEGVAAHGAVCSGCTLDSTPARGRHALGVGGCLDYVELVARFLAAGAPRPTQRDLGHVARPN